MYENNKNFEKAREWYEKSSKHGYPFALYNLGLMYYQGKGGPQDLYKARACFEKIAAQGDKVAQSALGFVYECEGGEKNLKKLLNGIKKVRFKDMLKRNVH